MITSENVDSLKLVDRYFKLTSDLRRGQQNAVQRLMKFWQIDGVLEITGAKPENEIFEGQMAIHYLYKNRLGTGVINNQQGLGSKKFNEKVLANFNNTINTIEQYNDSIIAGWSACISNGSGCLFNFSGSHLFRFYEGKIKHLFIDVSEGQVAGKDKEINKAGTSVFDEEILSLALAFAV